MPKMHQRSRRQLTRRGSLALPLIVGITAATASSALASPHHALPRAQSAATAGAAFGGVTPQGWPVVIELSKNGRQVVRAAIGLRLPCTAGGFTNLADQYVRLPVSTKGKFSKSFGPEVVRNDDGTTTDFEGSVSGALNAARTKLSGKWQLKLTQHDAAGAVTDTCNSGSVSWTAKQ